MGTDVEPNNGHCAEAKPNNGECTHEDDVEAEEEEHMMKQPNARPVPTLRSTSNNGENVRTATELTSNTD